MADGREVKVGQRWRHYKGGEYDVVALATIEKNMTPAVVYKSLEHGGVWVRPLAEFLGTMDEDGRVPRFALVM